MIHTCVILHVTPDRYRQVHLKQCEYHEKVQYLFYSFQRVKPIYYIDLLHT